MGGRQGIPSSCTDCKSPITLKTKVPLTVEPRCNNCKMITLVCKGCKRHYQRIGVPTGYVEEDCKDLDVLCSRCSVKVRHEKHTVVTCYTCHTTFDIYGDEVMGFNDKQKNLWNCTRCAAETQKKLADGDYHYAEVADMQGRRIVMFSRQLQPNIQNTCTVATKRKVRQESNVLFFKSFM